MEAGGRIERLLRGARSRTGLAALLEALGVEPAAVEVPASGYGAYGLADASLEALIVAGRSGSVRVLLFELAVPATAEAAGRLARRVRRVDAVRPYLFIVASPGYRELAFAVFGPGGVLRCLVVDRVRPRPAALQTLAEMAEGDGEGVALLLRWVRAFDRRRITRRFFRDFRSQRDRVAGAWAGIDASASRERRQLALLFLCRLMFLYFLQRRRLLAGDPDFLLGRFREHRDADTHDGGGAGCGTGDAAECGAGDGGRRGSFYRRVLDPLFFAVLNTRPALRDAAAGALGEIPYLNGGLFERHVLERRHPALDLGDDVVASVFTDLLERYRFTARGPGDAVVEALDEVGIDPEMLGRVFEELMGADRRGRTGSYYTPAPVVDHVVREATAEYLAGAGRLSADAARALVDGAPCPPGVCATELAERIDRITVLDPACGSGAFLLGALSRLSRIGARLSGDAVSALRRRMVGRALHGVDLLDEAALLCSLRLWLSLTFRHAAEVRPLPNLDRRIRQGDALIDPLDLARRPASAARSGPAGDAGVLAALRALRAATGRYADAGPELRATLRPRIARAELELARAWLSALDRTLDAEIAELRALAASRDLFGERSPAAVRAGAELDRLQTRRAEVSRRRRELDERGAVPFFSFDIHFPDAAGGFDLIVSNPPWVRAHRWPDRLRRTAGERYLVARSPGWRAGAALAGAPAGVAGQLDLSLLFLERSLRLLAPDGVLAMLVPTKVFRSLYGAGGRRLLRDWATLVALEDHALDPHSIFRADAFAGLVLARRGGRGGADPAEVRVTMVRRGVDPLRFAVPRGELALRPGDPESPWLLVPPGVRSAVRTMQAAGPALGATDHTIRRGVMTGANDVLLLSEVEHKLGGLAVVRARGAGSARGEGAASAYEAVVESAGIRPAVRGTDIDAWRCEPTCSIIWCHDEGGAPVAAPKRLARYLERHRGRLERRSGWRPGRPLGAVFRVRDGVAGPKVAWQDLSDTVKAVALTGAGKDGPGTPGGRLVPLNTVYFVPTASDREALILAGLLNSLPVRTFCRAIAERAKDARFRFFAWTMALIPLPPSWREGPAARELFRLSAAAHARGRPTDEETVALDRVAAGLYGLGHDAVAALAEFDRWLRGVVA